MAPFPDPTPVFHITAIDNLVSIIGAGAILSKNLVMQRGLVAADIAYEGVQSLRSVKAVQEGPEGSLRNHIGPGGNLHDYVPLYFAPRSPMLFTINEGNVPQCNYRQDDIVHLVSHAQKICDDGHRFVFTDFHAVKAFASFFDDLVHLDKIDWQLFFEDPCLEGYCKYWHNRHGTPHHVRRQETRMAEFLVHQSLPIAAISEIGVRTRQGERRIRTALNGTGWNPTIR